MSCPVDSRGVVVVSSPFPEPVPVPDPEPVPVPEPVLPVDPESEPDPVLLELLLEELFALSPV